MINLFKKPYKKKAGKFQPFKKLFSKRKKREPASDCEEAKLKPSHSFGNVCNGTSSSDEEPNGGLRSSHYSMGSRAFSHDSIFIPDGRTEGEQAIQAMSQENVLGKVKTLQQQLAKNIKFGQPPQMTISVRTLGEANTNIEEDTLLSSPMEIETQQQDTVISDSGNKSADTPDMLRAMNLPGTGHEVEEKVTPVKSSRPKRQFSCSGTIETINLDSVPQAVARLDNSAAKHKLSVKPKKQRMSRKHKRLTKGSQSLTITEFEPEDLEIQVYGDRYPSYNGHIITDKLIQNRDEQKQLQLAEEKITEDHWGILEAERIRQIVEMEEQREMEEQKCQELEQMQKEQERRCCEEERRQYLLEGETTLETEEQTCHKDERRLLEDEKRQDLEEQRLQELEKQRWKKLEEQQVQELEEKHQELERQQRHELEEQRHWEWEEQQRRELKEQKIQEREEQQRRELKEQKIQEREEQQRQEMEEQKLRDKEQQRRELEEKKLREREGQQRREMEEQKLQEQKEQQRQELEEKKLREWEGQQRREMEEQKLQEQKEQQRREMEEQKLREREEQQRREMEEQKLREREEQQRREMEKQKLREREEQQRREMEEQKLQEQEEKQKQELEEQKLREREEQQRREMEEQKLREQEEQKKHQEMEKQKHQEWEEHRCKKLEEKQGQELEDQKRLEQEELRQQEIEKWHQEEEERNRLEKQKELKDKEEKQRQELEEKEFQEAEIKMRQEKKAESLKQQKKQEEQRQHLKEKGEKIENEQPQQVMDKKKKWEGQRKHKLTKQMHMESAETVPQDELKQLKEHNEKEWNKLEEQEVDTKGKSLQQNQQEKFLEQQQDKVELCTGSGDRHAVQEKLQEGSGSPKLKQPEKGNKTAEEVLAQKLKREVEAQEQKRIGEELRWQEVDERQTTSRPFTFQVSSGDKEIIFQKVNLSPVMPVKEAGLSSPSIKDYRMHTSSKVSHTLPSSVCVPHTAILVTGAQLCGTAVNLNQIKDTACKSLLGLTEERKNVDIPSPEKAQKKKQDPKTSSGKIKYAQETVNNQAVLAEWASIRSRILKNAENGKYNERDRGSVCRHSDDWTPRGRGGPHGNLRKTLSANAKFSITPAWQKFSEASKSSSHTENVSVAKGSETVAVNRITGSSTDLKEDAASTAKDNLTEKAKEKMETHSEMTDNTEGCKFAKDLPSFLVPSFSHSLGKELPQTELPSALENQQNNNTKKVDKPAPNGEENISPFGIKLRRTNYSLRFHYDQQTEQKKKKRYSAGDSFDGVPDPLITMEDEKESTVFAPQESTSPGMGRVPGNLKDSKDSPVTVVEVSQPAGSPVVLPAMGQSALPLHEKPACKSLVPQKPALAPKPTSQTPPSSPLSKMNRSNLADTLGQRFVKAESDRGWRKEDRANAVHPTPPNEYKNEEEEIREKKSFFPSISIPWREKNDKKPEPLKKEKPVLQSRHSLDGSKLMEKVETSQPLWITLALQKQKGFREQQATREERRQAREAKQAEKLAKENAALSNQSDNKSSSSKTSTLQKSTTQEGEKKIETAVSRLERREQLKKSNTLPTSVTVEISDSVPSTPLAKEVAKRFSTPDANPVSTEPAWLALAKRKAKAWSDCPQIIK